MVARNGKSVMKLVRLLSIGFYSGLKVLKIKGFVWKKNCWMASLAMTAFF